MGLNADDFDSVRALLRQQSGIILEDGKEYLVETRLKPVARQAGLASLSELIAQLRRRPINDLHLRAVEALMTNETHFFRDVHPFDALESTILPELIGKRSGLRQLNVWCAAASTGQEPYSLAILLAESFPQLASWNIQCIASDISDQVLERGRRGKYRQLEIDRGLPRTLLEKYFTQQGDHWQIDESIRRSIQFRNINLVAAWPALPKMDIILMRNVLIYFDVPTKKSILQKVRRVLQPDGYLFLGTAETTLNLDDAFQQFHVGPTVCYRLRSGD